MIYPANIINVARLSGYDYVEFDSTTPPGGKPYRGKVGRTDSGYTFRGPRRASAREAAQDYCDFINGNPAATPARLRNAGHKSQRDQIARDPEVIAALGVLRDARGRRQGRDGYVYCIGEQGSEFVKIGYSTKPLSRIGELQSGNPRKLVLLGSIPAPDHEETERQLHRRFHRNNVLGEWFKATPSILKEFGLTKKTMESKVMT